MTSILKRRHFILAASAASLAVPSFAISASSAEAFAKRALDEMQVLVNSGGSNASREAGTRAFFRKYSDVSTIARTVLGAPWRGMSDQQRRDYVSAFEGYVVRKYSRMFGKVKGGTVKMLGSSGGGSAGVRVDAQFDYPGSNPYKVQLQVVDLNGSPKVLDLRVLGVSLISTERSTIRNLLTNSPSANDTLIKKLNNM